jgi:methylated-DNA-protein-cysteine methyltransferase-like protein
MCASFTSPPDVHLFNAHVYAVVRQIPRGRVASYGQVGMWALRRAGMPVEAYRIQAARWTGAAMAGSPEGVPWQRVINARGRISLPGAAGVQQRALLEAEGVEFSAKGVIDLKRFAWTGPGSG